jgi:hypothetical protein
MSKFYKEGQVVQHKYSGRYYLVVRDIGEAENRTVTVQGENGEIVKFKGYDCCRATASTEYRFLEATRAIRKKPGATNTAVSINLKNLILSLNNPWVYLTLIVLFVAIRYLPITEGVFGVLYMLQLVAFIPLDLLMYGAVLQACSNTIYKPDKETLKDSLFYFNFRLIYLPVSVFIEKLITANLPNSNFSKALARLPEFHVIDSVIIFTLYMIALWLFRRSTRANL